MASINSTSGNSYVSSLYNSANIVSGLASGLDTESMIEQLVSSYNTKIQQLSNKATKLEWKQEAYRNIISKLYAFSNKYASYTSATNLLSRSFFNNARIVTPQGKYADLVSAKGKTDSEVVLNKVDQLATAARYVTSGNLAGIGSDDTITATEAVDLNGSMAVGTLDGSLSLSYGSKSVSITFNENDVYKNAEELAAGIREKLSEQTIALSDGTSAKASDRIDVSVDGNGNITFKDKSGAGNNVYIAGATGNAAKEFNLTGITSSDKLTQMEVGDGNFTKLVNTAEQLSGKSFSITLNGVTKTIQGPEIEENEDGSYTLTGAGGRKYTVYDDYVGSKYAELLNESIQNTFGDSIKVENIATDKNGDKDDSKLQLKFTTTDDSDLTVSSSVGEMLKIGSTASNYIDPDKTLGELMGKDAFNVLSKNADGKYDFKINGVTIGSYDEDTTLTTLINDINNNTDTGVKVSYSRTTRNFVFESRETGSQGKVDLDFGLAQRLFGTQYVEGDGEFIAGQDSKFTVTVNGIEKTLTRSSNTVDIDGLNITFKDTFGPDLEAGEKAGAANVTFKISTDSDKIVDTIRGMVDDYNEMMSAIRSAYATMPYQNSSGTFQNYEPLTDEDRATMSESAIQAYEEKAKQGLLFGDSNLKNLYQRMYDVFNRSGTDNDLLRNMGLSMSFSITDGTSYLTLDETKLREMLDSDPDAVADIFTRTSDSGGTSGIMEGLKTQLDRYGSTSGAVKGILVQQSGTPLSALSLLDNDWQKQIDSLGTQIQKWQDKLSNRVDYYTSMFSRMETLINQLNSQSSALASLMGG